VIDPSKPSAQQVHAELGRVLSSPEFQANQRLASFLAHVVAKTLEARSDEIKEATIGVEVFGRKPGYDTRSDAIVRTEARRLREKLTQYYLGYGRDAVVRIEIPKGAYVPQFHLEADPQPTPLPIPPKAMSGRWRWVLAVAALILGLLLSGQFGFRPRPARLPIRTIAILPFADAKADQHYQYLSEGIKEDLERDLARAKDLRIHTDPPASWLKPREGLDYGALSKQLQVQAVLDGQISQVPGHTEIRAALIRASDASILWTDRFDPAIGAGALEARIEQAVAEAVGVSLPGVVHVENPQAHDLFLEGRNLWATRNEKEGMESIALFERALQLDPGYALAYMGIADAYGLMALHEEIDLPAAIRKGKLAAQKAIELDPTLAEAHAALGLLDFVDWDWKEAEREYQSAMDLNPSYDRPYVRLGVLLFYDGDHKNAERLMMQGESLSPYSLALPVIRAEAYYYWRQYADSVKLARKVLQIDPHNSSAMGILACDYWQQGDQREALDTVRKLHEGDPTFQLDLIPCVAAVGGFGKEVIAAAVSPHESNPYVSAIISSAQHDREGVLSGLEKALAEHSPDLPAARFEPDFDFVRGDKRFQAVMAKERAGGIGENSRELSSSRGNPAQNFFQTGLR
jgi:TolB-like protein/cytochrome c-type biogenesis protein CcmH/NrfG